MRKRNFRTRRIRIEIDGRAICLKCGHEGLNVEGVNKRDMTLICRRCGKRYFMV